MGSDCIPLQSDVTSTNWRTPQQVELTAGHDADLQDDRVEFVVTASGGGFDGERGIVSVTILDDDAVSVPSARISATPTEINEGDS